MLRQCGDDDQVRTTPVEAVSIYEAHWKDVQRVLSYWHAICGKTDRFADAIVMDISQNNGLYACMAVRAGARNCYVMEESQEEADHTKEILKLNGFYDRCQVFVSGDGWSTPEMADVLIHECMGDCLFVRSRIRDVINARDAYLKPNGTVAPNLVALYISGVDNGLLRESAINFWETPVRGFDMKCFKETSLNEPEFEFCPSQAVTTSESFLHCVNFNTLSPQDISEGVDAQFLLTANRSPAVVNGFAIYFKVHFSGCQDAKSGFSTSPSDPTTAWHQCVCLVENELKMMNEGDEIHGRFRLRIENVERISGVKIGLRFRRNDSAAEKRNYIFHDSE